MENDATLVKYPNINSASLNETSSGYNATAKCSKFPLSDKLVIFVSSGNLSNLPSLFALHRHNA